LSPTGTTQSSFKVFIVCKASVARFYLGHTSVILVKVSIYRLKDDDNLGEERGRGENITLLEGSQASPARPSYERIMKVMPLRW
jgi:hypothetical protein